MIHVYFPYSLYFVRKYTAVDHFIVSIIEFLGGQVKYFDIYTDERKNKEFWAGMNNSTHFPLYYFF